MQAIARLPGSGLGGDLICLTSAQRRCRCNSWLGCVQTLFGQSRQKLDGEEWITTGLFVHQLRQWPGACRFTMQSIDNQPSNIVQQEGPEHDFVQLGVGVADRRERPEKRMVGADFIIPVGSHEQQASNFRVRDQVPEQVKRRSVDPLQIVQEKGEQVLLARECSEEAAEYRLKTILGILGRKIWNWRLLSNNKFQFRNQIYNELAVRADRLAQGFAPPA